MGTETAFGVSRLLEPGDSAELRSFLESAWRSQLGSQPGELVVDLKKLRKWFRPDHRLKNLRAAVVDLSPAQTEPPPGLPEQCFLRLGGSRGLVTPEGRGLLELLLQDGHQIRAPELYEVGAAVAEFYGEEYRTYLRHNVMGGDSRPNTIAFIFFLLLNGSMGQERGLTCPSASADERRAMEAIAETIAPIAAGIGGKGISESGRTTIKGNWILTESSAQFPLLVAHDKHGYWIRPEASEELPDRLAARIAELQKAPGVAELSLALDDSLVNYQAVRPTLVALGLSHYRPDRARRSYKQILAAYRRRGP